MHKNEIIAFIKNVELFQDLDAKELDLVAGLVEVKSYTPKTVLFRQHYERRYIFIIYDGEVQLYKDEAYGEKRNLVVFGKNDFLGDNVLIDDSVYSTSTKTLSDAKILTLDSRQLKDAHDKYGDTLLNMIRRIAKVMVRRMIAASSNVENVASQYLTGKTRSEHDLLGDREVPHELYYGI